MSFGRTPRQPTTATIQPAGAYGRTPLRPAASKPRKACLYAHGGWISEAIHCKLCSIIAHYEVAMPIIPDRDRDDLKRDFRKELKDDVTIRLFSQGSSLLAIPGRECKYCPQTQELMEELTSLSPKLHLEVYDFYNQVEEREQYGVERIPAIVMGKNGDSRLKFYGIPMGYEFATIVEDIKTLSRGVSPLSMDTRKRLRKVNQEVHIQVFVTPN